MKIYCKCGFCLTAEVQKTKKADAFEVVYTQSTVGSDRTFDQVNIKRGVYFRWKYLDRWYRINGYPNVYKVHYKDLVDGCITNTVNGCCFWDHFDVQCPSCKTIIGDGGNDCHQSATAELTCTKVEIGL